MSLSIQYESLQEAEMRLQGTVVLYDEQPVYITRVTGAAPGDPKPDIFRVYAVPLPSRAGVGRVEDEEFRRFISSRRFDFRTIPLGFMNLAGGIYYCTRLPQRQQKQGLANATFGCTEIAGPRGEGFRLNSVIQNKEFVSMVRGEYPTFEQAMAAVSKNGVFGMAFSRHYALVSDDDLDGLVYLYYKNEKVGFLMDSKVTLSSKMTCLKEALTELGLRL